MNDSENIKALIPVVCPHCSQTLVVEFLIGANLLSPEMASDVIKNITSTDENEPSKEEEEIAS